MLPELDDPSIREVLIYSYRLIYQISSGEIEVLALVHARRDFVADALDDSKE